MIKLFCKLACTVTLLFCFAVGAMAQDVTLSWDPSPTPDVAGYYVYYQKDSPSLPFNSTDALEGPSPVDVGNSLTTTLTGLSDDTIYYFAIAAYDSALNESSFSNIVSNSWVPTLLAPEDNASDEPAQAMFRWTTEASGAFTYTLYYGTDAASVGTAGNIPPAGGFNVPPNALLFGLLLTLFFFLLRLPLRPKTAIACGTLSICVALTACGGGGGGGDSSSSRTSTESTPATTATDTAVYSVDKGTSDYHQAYAGDLEAGTTYYWKVVGVDSSNPTQQHSSTISSFTTTPSL